MEVVYAENAHSKSLIYSGTEALSQPSTGWGNLQAQEMNDFNEAFVEFLSFWDLKVTFCHQVTFFSVIFSMLHKRNTHPSINKTADQQYKQSRPTYLFIPCLQLVPVTACQSRIQSSANNLTYNPFFFCLHLIVPNQEKMRRENTSPHPMIIFFNLFQALRHVIKVIFRLGPMIT